MQEEQIEKLVITVINVLVLGSLPFWFAWHIKQMKNLNYLSYDYWIQFIIVLLYGAAINAEIPALWSRWVSYYDYNLSLPKLIYVLTTWDRFGHLGLYLIIMFLTWSITYKRVPKTFTDTFV
jgi:hypothetical protein